MTPEKIENFIMGWVLPFFLIMLATPTGILIIYITWKCFLYFVFGVGSLTL